MLSSSLIPGVYFLCLILSPVAHAATFNPNCTLPPSNTKFVAGPNIRGTLSILWNCLSIIILCTWNIQHLNIPSRRPYYDKFGKKHGLMKRTWWIIVDMKTDLWWMLLTILVPEYIMGRALSERLAAASSLETLRSRFGEEMEMVHAYIMNMGGYYLDFSEISSSGVDISKINSSGSSGLTSTAVDYSGVHFSGNHVTKDSDRSQGEANSLAASGGKLLDLSAISTVLETIKLPIQIIDKPVIKDQKGTILSPVDCNEAGCEAESRFQGISVPESPYTSSRVLAPSIMRPNVSEEPPQANLRSTSRKLPISNLTSFQALNLERLQQERWALTALQLLSAKGFKLFDSLPQISPQELESLSNGDSIVKFLAMLQILWLVIQLFVRYKENIISSQLEIATLAFSACSLLTYAILWDRPRGVTTRYRVKASKVAKVDEILLLATFGPGYLWTWHRLQGKEDEDLNLMPIPNDASHAVDVRNLVGRFENTVMARKLVEWLRHHHPAVVSVIAGSVLGGILFGSIHCLAWNFSFPTNTELILWRVCSIVTTILPILSVYFNLQWLHWNGWAELSEHTIAERIHGPVLLICFAFPYILARSFLLVEIFRSLFFLPPEAFIDTWPGAFLLWG